MKTTHDSISCLDWTISIEKISTGQTKQLVISEKKILRPKITYDNVILVF